MPLRATAVTAHNGRRDGNAPSHTEVGDAQFEKFRRLMRFLVYSSADAASRVHGRREQPGYTPGMTSEPAQDREPNESERLEFLLPIEQLIGRWRRLLTSFGHRYRLDAAELDEIEQDVRIRLWRHADRTGDTDTAPSYVYKAVMSALMDLLRKRRVHSRRRVPMDDVSASLAATPDSPAEAAVMAALDRALGQLDQARRVVVRLHLDGKDQAAIAAILGWSDAKVRNLLYRGLEDLREQLQEEPGA